MYFAVSEKGKGDKIIVYNNVGLISYSFEHVASIRTENRRFRQSHYHSTSLQISA